jgi:hypothetical protein
VLGVRQTGIFRPPVTESPSATRLSCLKLEGERIRCVRLDKPIGDRRVALGGHPPKAPTDPHERISRMRFFKSWFRCIT